MGGYGAVTLALRYRSLRGRREPLGRLSLVMRDRPRMPRQRDTRRRSMRRAAVFTRLWRSCSRLGRDTMAGTPATGDLCRKLAITCEASRLLIDVGREILPRAEPRLPSDLSALGIPMRYAEWPGKHDWMYWRTHVLESLTGWRV